MARDPERLLDMLNAARRIVRRLREVNRHEFDADEDLQIVAVHLIQVIGEAARNISDEFQAMHSDIPWREIVSMRHRIVHDYLNINIAKVWETATEDIPTLIAMIEPLVPPEEPPA
jgi:uncharacterized protein with HEPN domain